MFRIPRIFLTFAGITALTVFGGPLVGLAQTPDHPSPGPGRIAGPSAPGAPVRVPFGPGEDLRFAVKYGFVRAGDATLSVRGPEKIRGEAVLRLVSTAQSSRFFSTFFKVEDTVSSWWSPRTGLPMRFEKRIREGKYSKDAALEFDHAAGTARDEKGQIHEILAGTQDVLSAFYYVRTQNLGPGTVLEVPNHSDGKNYPLMVRVVKRETIEVPAGRFACLVVEPLLQSAGLFKQEGSLTIWLTDDARRMPVLMKSKVAVGAIVAELESFRAGRPLGPLPGGARPTGAGR